MLPRSGAQRKGPTHAKKVRLIIIVVNSSGSACPWHAATFDYALSLLAQLYGIHFQKCRFTDGLLVRALSNDRARVRHSKIRYLQGPLSLMHEKGSPERYTWPLRFSSSDLQILLRLLAGAAFAFETLEHDQVILCFSKYVDNRRNFVRKSKNMASSPSNKT